MTILGKLREATSWAQVKRLFCEHLRVENNVVISDLRALDVNGWNVEDNTVHIHGIATQYPLQPGKEQWLKQIYTDKLP